ncbi:probable glutamate receptor [Salvelinus alpinus]|uniref:probable glutamate receptor n=1 Tax=Salvelinus alpinus TaxID=8036 RepID=UPI0039FDB83D
MKALIGLVVCAVALLSGCCTAGPAALSITTILQEPYTMTQGSELEGYCIDLLAEIAKKLGFKYEVHLVKDGKYGRQDESGNWHGMIGEVVRGEADLAVASLTLTATRELSVEMSTPFMQIGVGFILSRDPGSEESHFVSFLFPFSTEMWVGVLVAFLVTGLCIYLVARISPCEWADPETDEHSFTLLHSFWYITGALTLQGAGPHPKGLSGRIISAIWWVFAVVLLACYFSNFNTMLRSDTKHGSVMNFDELARQDVIDYGTVEGGSTFNFFKNSNNPTYRRIFQHMERKKSCVPSVEEGNRRAQEGNYAFIGEVASLDLAVARYCNLVRSSELIAMRGYSIAAPLGSPMMKNITVAILQLSESGELAYLQSKWWANSCMPEGGQAPQALQAHLLRGLFMLLALGCGLGLLIALLELASKARNQAKDQKKSCCSVLSAELSQRFRSGRANAGTETSEKSKA